MVSKDNGERGWGRLMQGGGAAATLSTLVCFACLIAARVCVCALQSGQVGWMHDVIVRQLFFCNPGVHEFAPRSVWRALLSAV